MTISIQCRIALFVIQAEFQSLIFGMFRFLGPGVINEEALLCCRHHVEHDSAALLCTKFKPLTAEMDPPLE